MFHFGKSWYTPPCFSERVRKGLKANRLEGKILCTENGRVRKKLDGKEIQEVKEMGEKDRADPPRGLGGIRRGRWRRIMREDSTKELLCQPIT